MYFNTQSVLFGVLYAAATVTATGFATCNANNCLRAVRASAFPTRPGTADCSSYFSVTVQKSGTVTEYITPTDIPAYASACSGSVKYSSACSCIGVPHVTTVIDITPTCDEGTESCGGGPCQDILSDPNNCGGCGVTCPSGVCKNGQCSVSTCDGSTCNSLNSCGSDCFCFKTSDDLGFCGPNISCAPLLDCTSTSDCAQGEVCATGTCCGRNVCLASCSSVTRRSSLFGRDVEVSYTGGRPPAL